MGAKPDFLELAPMPPADVRASRERLGLIPAWVQAGRPQPA